MSIIRRLFRYKFTAILFIIGQLMVYFIVFGALGIYNQAADREKDRQEAMYADNIELKVVTSKSVNIAKYAAKDIKEGNILLRGKTSCAIQELNNKYRCEIIICANENLKYKCISGRLPSANETGELEVAVGKNKYEKSKQDDRGRYLTIEAEKYYIVGILGSEKSDYWDDKIVFNINSIGNNLMEGLAGEREFEISIVSANNLTEDVYSQMYSNIRSVDSNSMIDSMRDRTMGTSSLKKSMQKNNIKTNILAYIFCLLNCMIISEFWIMQRRRDIEIKKLFGYSAFKLIKEMLNDIIMYNIVAVVLYALIYTFLKILHIQEKVMQINAVNIVVIISVMLISIISTMVLPMYKIITEKSKSIN